MTKLISRRNVLLGGALTGSVLTMGRLTWLAAPAVGMKVLSDREINTVEALARVLFPAGHFSVSGGDGHTAPIVDDLLAEYLRPKTTSAFRYLLKAIDVGCWVSRGAPFSRLSHEDAKEVVSIWTSKQPAPRRMASDGFKTMLGLAFFRRPEVVSEIGWRLGCPWEESL